MILGRSPTTNSNFELTGPRNHQISSFGQKFVSEHHLRRAKTTRFVDFRYTIIGQVDYFDMEDHLLDNVLSLSCTLNMLIEFLPTSSVIFSTSLIWFTYRLNLSVEFPVIFFRYFIIDMVHLSVEFPVIFSPSSSHVVHLSVEFIFIL